MAPAGAPGETPAPGNPLSLELKYIADSCFGGSNYNPFFTREADLQAAPRKGRRLFGGLR
jgi:hypothetical protein